MERRADKQEPSLGKEEQRVDTLEQCIDAMLAQSEVCTTKEEKQFLVKSLGGRTFKTTKLYRGSEDGFMSEDFHRLCDGKGPTISLFKAKGNKHCIGGFTNGQWSAPDRETLVADSGAVVFNLTQQTAFPVTDKDKAITCAKTEGPCFTNTLWANEPFNGLNECRSWYVNSSYKSKVVDGFDQLLNEKANDP